MPYKFVKTCKHMNYGVLVFNLTLAAMGSAKVWAGDYSNHPETKAFIQQMKTQHKMSEEKLTKLLTNAKRQQSILDAISRPAEKTKTWGEYQKIFLTPQRVKAAVAFYKNNRKTFKLAEQHYGVPAETILAIIGVETFYGKNKGSYRVLDALATLGFDYPPRATFFKSELKHYLLMTEEQKVDPLSLKGSYAGAIGYPQFIPSSFRQYAVDFDNDGKINLWSNPVDAIGSVANYFRRHGWQPGEAVAVRVSVKGNQFKKGIGKDLKPASTVSELQQLGWRYQHANLLGESKARGVELQGAKGKEYWLTLNNFYVITRYNHSTLYAMAVHQLSDQIKAKIKPKSKPKSKEA
ncbi:lytic murein transglycosylase B [Zooshikella sp. WH53]|uniref:Lytic murein transglycosylase B n=1 Tax=Zooshikella harenae TaxID=2827238 RepID=A0ABS5ZH47_9GAMM|nr:lytic murein transglycosylase B [Zooshikella harenae]